MVAATKTAAASMSSDRQLHRVIGWKDAFWVASGVPALVLFSIGGIAATVAQIDSMRVTELQGIELEYHTVVKNELRRMSRQVGEAAGLLRANEQRENDLFREYNEISERLSMIKEQVGEFLAMHG